MTKGYTPDPDITREEAAAIVETKKLPRITKELIDSRIAAVTYMRPNEIQYLTICIITMANEFHFIGKSAPASPLNFDEKVGERYAYDDAYRQIWSHEAYLLKEQEDVLWNS